MKESLPNLVRNKGYEQYNMEKKSSFSYLVRLVISFTIMSIVSSLNNGFTLPSLSWSSWNHFQGSISDSLMRECADAVVSSGLRDAG